MRLTRIALMLLTFTAAASAQVAEFSFSGGVNSVSNGRIGTNPDINMEGGFRFGFRVTLNNWRFFGHEFGYAYNRMKWEIANGGGEQGTAGHQGLYHFLAYATPEGARVRPFASGGAHFTNYIWPGYSVQQGGGNTKFGLNYGGGIKARVSGMWLIRADVRQYWNGKPFGDYLNGPGGSLRQNEISLGFGIGL